jgi:hypothetical protein
MQRSPARSAVAESHESTVQKQHYGVELVILLCPDIANTLVLLNTQNTLWINRNSERNNESKSGRQNTLNRCIA